MYKDLTMIKISASVLTADLSSLGEEVSRAKAAGADMLHIDVMDGVFVPPMTIGDVVVRSLRSNNKDLTLDTHLMVNKPSARLIENFAEAGSDIISIHVESGCDVRKTLEQIKSCGIEAGIAINPPTPIEKVFPFLGIADMFIVMSVNPGYGGQAFIPESLNKIAALREEARKHGVEELIEVDGGINADTAPEAVKAGADILVAGNYLFTAPDMKSAVDSLRRIDGNQNTL
jgi:ribulose-phosphate 3-epimerase